MTIPNGRYTLRASPAGGVGGMYATGHNEVNAPVTTAAQVPDVIGRQIWEIKAVHGKKDIYTIFLWTNGSTFGGSFTPKHHEGNPAGPVVTSQTVQEWYISPVETGIPETYRIAIHGEIVGVDNVVGTQGTEVVVKSIPIIVAEQEGKPYWKLHKID